MIVIVEACICSPSLTRQLHYHSQLDKSAARWWKSNEDTFASVTLSEALVGPKSCDRRFFVGKNCQCVDVQRISISSCGTAVGPRLRRLLRAFFFFFSLLSGGRESTVTGRPGGTLTCPLAATHSTDCMTCQRTFPPLSSTLPVARILRLHLSRATYSLDIYELVNAGEMLE